MPLTRVQRSYIAGIVDGEGSIMLQRSAARSSSNYIFPVLKIANTDRALMDWLEAKIGFGSRQYRSRMNEHCKDVHHLVVASNQAIALLRAIRPYLVVKARQADTVLAVWAENQAHLRQSGKPHFGHGNSIPERLRRFRSACYWYVRDLNSRGPHGFKYFAEVSELLEQGI